VRREDRVELVVLFSLPVTEATDAARVLRRVARVAIPPADVEGPTAAALASLLALIERSRERVRRAGESERQRSCEDGACKQAQGTQAHRRWTEVYNRAPCCTHASQYK